MRMKWHGVQNLKCITLFRIMKWWQEFITCLKSPDSLLHSTFTLISLGVHKLDEDSKLTRAWQYFHFCDPRRANPWTSGKLGLFCYAERQMNNQAWILLREWARATREFCVLFHTTFTKNKNWINGTLQIIWRRAGWVDVGAEVSDQGC